MSHSQKFVQIISRDLLFPILLLTIFLLLSAGVGAASPVKISVNTSSLSIEKGKDFTVNISVDPNNNLISAAQINLIFDASVVSVKSVTEGNLFKKTGVKNIFDNGTLNNSDGSLVNIWSIIITPGANITTKASFATITFYAKDLGNSTLNLSNVIVSTPSSQELNTSMTGASISVYPRPSVHQENSSTTYGVSSSGGGGGGGGTSGENFSNIEIKEKYDLFINKDQTTSYVFKKTDPIISVNITGNNNAGEVNVAVEVLRNTSSLVRGPAPDTVYKDINIWAGTYGFATPKNIKHAEIVFRVQKSWIYSNGIDPGSITMMHYRGAWESLPTEKISEDDEWVYYEASATSFSLHAITGKKSYGGRFSETTASTQSQKAEKPIGPDGNRTGATPGNPGQYLVMGAFIGIALNAALIYKIRKSRQRELFNDQEDL